MLTLTFLSISDEFIIANASILSRSNVFTFRILVTWKVSFVNYIAVFKRFIDLMFFYTRLRWSCCVEFDAQINWQAFQTSMWGICSKALFAITLNKNNRENLWLAKLYTIEYIHNWYHHTKKLTFIWTYCIDANRIRLCAKMTRLISLMSNMVTFIMIYGLE